MRVFANIFLNSRIPYHPVDDDIEEPDFFDTPMKDVTVYYPSRDDRDPVEVTYAGMKCLEPGACLSSSIMNYYMRYLQQLTDPSLAIATHCPNLKATKHTPNNS